MNATKIFEEITTILRQRPDFIQAEQQECGESSYLSVTLQGGKRATDIQNLILHLLNTGNGPVLRVLLLSIPKPPPLINTKNLCSTLNKKLMFGRFIEIEAGALAFCANHMLSSGPLDVDIVNRAITFALSASAFCRTAILQTTELAEQLVLHPKGSSDCNTSLN